MAGALPTNRAGFDLHEILAATGGRKRGGPDRVKTVAVSTDSRAIEPGSIFVALEGDRFDGHKFVATAVAAGALVVIVSRPVDVPADVAVVEVADTRAALGALARAHRRRWASTPHRAGARAVIAIVGAAGKTTTRKTIAALVGASAPGAVHATAANFNNQIGVPLTLLGLADEHRFAVIEVGTNQRGEVAMLARIVEPDVGVLTLIAPEHTEGLGSIEEVADEEGDLLAALRLDGVAVGNGDDPRVRQQMERAPCRKLTWGFAPGADVLISSRTPVGFDQSLVEIDGRRFSIPLLGDAGALACAAAIAVDERALGHRHDEHALARAFATLADERDGRLGATARADGAVIIDDSYNANPGSMRASIAAARELAVANDRRLVLVLGEMRELGGLSKSEHEQLGAWLAEPSAKRPVLLGVAGDAARLVQVASERGVCARFVATSEEAAVVAAGWVRPGDVVLVKGSRGVRTERVVAALLAAR
jgi:UDP-N-acetylmuramoyl-tripeptide--D-alanyl-D-alanine ligase